ncbi:MAG: cation diffusion facilitator family transporter [Bdellovibrionia bacterium]
MSLEHSHSHSHDHHVFAHQTPRLLWKAIFITALFMVVEFVGGWWANSLALVSDGAHMLTDIGAMSLSLFALWYARRPSTPSMSFGYGRAEILGALISVLLIWFVGGVLIFEAVLRLKAPPVVQAPIVFIVASVGLLANLLSMRILHPAKESNINVKAAYLHLLSDSLGSIGAIVSGAVLWLTGWQPIDPLISILFAVLMLLSSWGLLKETLGVLMESAPSHLNPNQVRADLEALEGVEEVHNLHIWSVSNGRLALSVHLISRQTERLLDAAHGLLSEKYRIRHTTIQIEHPELFQSERCDPSRTSR